ncbi:MAG: hypothetical protein Hens3KO_04060 [Henriciella sp.]
MKPISILILTGLFAFSAQADPEADFKKMDANKDGYLIQTEFVAAKMASGEMTDSEAVLAFIKIDKDASGAISLAEFEDASTKPDQPDDAAKPMDDNER